MRLADRVAIVTGGSRGIGRAYTERFLHEGAAVVIADVDDANGEKTRSELRDLGTVEYVHCDVWRMPVPPTRASARRSSVSVGSTFS